MTKALTYEQLLLLGPDAIRELYPFGAKEWKKRWIPAQRGKADKTLSTILKEKRKRRSRDVPKLVKMSGSGYTSDPKYALGNKSRYSMPFDALTGEEDEDRGPEPEAVDDETQHHFSQEAKNRRAVMRAEDERRAEIRSCLGRLRQLSIDQVKAGTDPVPMLQALIEQFQDKGRKAA